MITLRIVLSFLVLVTTQAAAPDRLPTLIERASTVDELYRLRRVSEPLSYKLFLDISDEEFSRYTGSVDIEMRYLDEQDFFYLNSAGVMIDRNSIKVTKANGGDLPVAQFTPLVRHEQLYFEFEEKLEKDAVYNVHIEFSNKIGTELKGLYRSSYKVGNKTRYIATTHFESTYARTVFPCYDEPSYKSYFDVSIRHRSKYHALSNMPSKKTVQDGEKFKITHFKTTPFMSTYLLAFIVSDYATKSNMDDRVRVYAPENQVQHTTYAIDFAQKSLKALEKLLGHSFQLPKVDLVAIPDFNMGAMENWGLITFRAVYLIYDEETTTARTKQNIADLITHEFVHSWFGNEVTPEWWTYLWLSEGFARYFEYYVTAQIEDSWHLWEQFIVNNVHSALSQDDKTDNRPMSFYETEPDVLNGLFDYVVYAKSASVIRMIENVIGFDAFMAALNDYIASRSFKTTKPDYLYASIEKFNKAVLPAGITEIFNSWADNAGYPVISVTRNGDQVTYSQKRFWMPVEEENAPPPNNKYFVPLNYATSTEANFSDTTAVYWLTPEVPQITKQVPSTAEWILVNKQQTGFYRVNYDKENWASLTNLLNSKNTETMPVVNRAQLVDDVSNLAKAGEIGYDVALTLLQYLEQEKEYIPWSTAYNALIHLNRMFSGNKDYSRFEDFVRSIVAKMYERVRLTDAKDHISRLHRGNTVYLACYFGVKQCVDDSQKLMQKMLDKKSYIVPEEVQSAVFCAVQKHDTSLQMDQAALAVFEKYLSQRETHGDMINRFIAGMGCTRNTSRIDSYLLLSLTERHISTFTRSERSQILTSVLSGSYDGLRTGLQFILRDYRFMPSTYGSTAGIFTEIGNRVNTKETFELLQDIVAKYGNTFDDAARTAASKALTQASKNVAWAEKHSKSIADWLITNDYEFTAPPDDDGAASSIVAGFMLTTIMCILANVL